MEHQKIHKFRRKISSYGFIVWQDMGGVIGADVGKKYFRDGQNHVIRQLMRIRKARPRMI